MNTREVTTGELGLLAATRVFLGVGIGLLLSEKFSNEQRRAIGWSLALTGLITTIPLAVSILPRKQESESKQSARRTAQLLAD